MRIQSPFHSGEILVQELAGDREVAERNGAMIADTIVPGALPFLRRQQLFLLGISSAQGDVWASVLFGPPGFLESEDRKTLRIHVEPGARDGEDPLWKELAPGKAIGGLAIDLATRQRLRVNGRVAAFDPDLLTLAVEEAYPNCPKYIQRRRLRQPIRPQPQPTEYESGDSLNATVRRMIEQADTMFVASANPEGGTDVSHRGGPSGFISVLDDGRLDIPDYSGNGMFNTLGNLAVNPASGILIVDFASHRILQMTGSAQIQWRSAPSAPVGPVTDRSWTFRIRRWLSRPLPTAMEWEFMDFSPHNPS